ncbi:fucose-1-phosphate guanylyltransferase [Trichomycterus rosablanca]|uniref:fucose-1-phosphate guanylyltransferase n=1 Tax=Trichomycterus rosablanca TaxID=2290929 RepID=UPI002F35520C
MTEQIKNKRLEKSTKQKLDEFNKIKGVEVKAGDFWDLVVITAVDDHQKSAYELQMREKKQRNELPISLHYHVFADPPGYKIGNGGSTLHALHSLSEMYGESLSKLKIILIHAGGFSQRLPNASALGKIFMAVPLGEPLYQMLEIKLAMYVHFPAGMKPGVLVTCADDMELYSTEEKLVFDKPGFTALAHPSPVSVGTTHGVFVLKPDEGPPTRDVEYRTCLRFLHKPSVDAMHQSGAVFREMDEQLVYTDSTYYMDHGTAMALLDLFQKIRPLTCEIDAYGDFLQSLGSGATSEYVNNTANVLIKENELVQVREKIFQHLRGTPLNVIVLNESKFYHVGTMEEYLYHFTLDPCLRGELGLLSTTFSLCPPDVCDEKNVCVMHSVVQPGCRISAGSVVEYSRLDPGVTVGQNSIISSCWVDSGLSVPPHTFFHSLSVSSDAGLGSVTVAFGVLDDLKKTVPGHAHLNRLEMFGVSLQEVVSRWGWSSEDVRFSGGGTVLNLWNCRLFPVCGDMRSSFSSTLKMVRAAQGHKNTTLSKHSQRLSLQDVLQNKDLENMLKFRRELYEEILQNK